MGGNVVASRLRFWLAAVAIMAAIMVLGSTQSQALPDAGRS